MTSKVRRTVAILFVVALAPADRGPATYAGPVAETPAHRIVRDAFGVPHVYATTDAGLFFGAGYATAEDRLFQLDLFRRGALGRLAEVLGAFLLEADRLERVRGYTAAEYEAIVGDLAPADRARYAAYADGINAYIEQAVADPVAKLPFEFHALGYRPEPWTVRDTFAVARFILRRFGEFGGSELANQAAFQALEGAYGTDEAPAMFNDLSWRIDPKAPVTIPAGPGGAMGAAGGAGTDGDAGTDPTAAGAAEVAGRGAARVVETTAPSTPPLRLPGIERVAEDLGRRTAAAEAGWRSVGVPSRLGSYAMLVGPSKSASGRPLLYYGPQMGFDYPDLIYEMHLVGGDGGAWDVYGAAIPGLGGPFVGQNRDLAWGFTSGYADNIDVFAERLDPDDPSRYRYQDGWRAMDVRVEQIAVRTSPIGQALATSTSPYTVTRTVHGPVLAVDAAHGMAYSERRQMWAREARFAAAVTRLQLARSAADFAAGAAQLGGSFNAHVATAAGDIGYWHTSHIPERSDGAFVGRFPWPGDGGAEWTGDLRPIASAVNPAQGYLANWNNRPDPAFANGDATLFGTQHRVERVFALLESKERLTRDDLEGIVKDLAVLNPQNGSGMIRMHVLGPMLGAARNGAGGDARILAAADRLAAWDGHFAPDAVASTTLAPEYTLFTEWRVAAAAATFGDELGVTGWTANWQHLIHAFEGPGAGVPPSRDYFDDIRTDGPTETAAQIMAATLRSTLDKLTAQFGTDDVDRWTAPRGVDEFRHPLLGVVGPGIPRSNRSTWAFLAEPGSGRPSVSLVPSGTSAFARVGPDGKPAFGPHALDQRERFARWAYKPMAPPAWWVFLPKVTYE